MGNAGLGGQEKAKPHSAESEHGQPGGHSHKSEGLAVTALLQEEASQRSHFSTVRERKEDAAGLSDQQTVTDIDSKTTRVTWFFEQGDLQSSLGCSYVNGILLDSNIETAQKHMAKALAVYTGRMRQIQILWVFHKLIF